MVRGDLTYYKDGMARRTTSSRPASSPRRAAPTTRTTQYVNDGFVLEEHACVDANNLAAGTVPFHRRYQLAGRAADTRRPRIANIALYVQDTWRPNAATDASTSASASTACKRNDNIFNIVRAEQLAHRRRASASRTC